MRSQWGQDWGPRYIEGPWVDRRSFGDNESGFAGLSIAIDGERAQSCCHILSKVRKVQIWLVVKNAKSIAIRNHVEAGDAFSGSSVNINIPVSPGDMPESASNACLDYYGMADASSSMLHTEQKAFPGASRGNGNLHVELCDFPEINVAAKGHDVVFREESRNANGQNASSEVHAQKAAAMPFYEGMADATNGTDTNDGEALAIAYPSRGGRISAETVTAYLQSDDGATEHAEAHALGLRKIMGVDVPGGLRGSTLYIGPMVAKAQSGGDVTTNIDGIRLIANMVSALSEYYADGSNNKYRMHAQSMGRARLNGSIATTARSRETSMGITLPGATLSGMNFSGTNYARLVDKRGSDNEVQTLISQNKSFSGRTATSNNAKGPIQNCVDLAANGDAIKLSAGIFREIVDIEKSLTIYGTGSGATIVDGNGMSTVFKIGITDYNIDVALRGMTIQNGNTGGGGGMGNGGGIYNRGRTTIERCVICNNVSTTSGGGIYNVGTVTILQSVIHNNRALSYNGGGVCNDADSEVVGTAIIEGGSIFQNFAGPGCCGGGIFNEGYSREGQRAILTLCGPELEIIDNEAGYSGGDWHTGGGVYSVYNIPQLLDGFALDQIRDNYPPP